MSPDKIVREQMLANDAFSQWLGIKVEEISEGYCRLSMQIRPEMTNGFGIAHGGIAYSAADSALAFAANSYGLLSVTVDGHMHYYHKMSEGDILEVEAKLMHKGKKISKFVVDVKTGDHLAGQMVGSIIHTKREW